MFRLLHKNNGKKKNTSHLVKTRSIWHKNDDNLRVLSSRLCLEVRPFFFRFVVDLAFTPLGRSVVRLKAAGLKLV